MQIRLSFLSLFIVLGDAFTQLTLPTQYGEVKSCNYLESKSTTLRLKRHLFCDYVKTVRPVTNHRNTTTVMVAILPKFAEFDTQRSVISIHCWTVLIWQDAHLTWNPSDFDGIEELHVNTEEIWLPDITIYNAADLDSVNEIPYTNCWVTYKGKVKCVPEGMFRTQCLTDHTWWPYNMMNCSIHFGSWVHRGDEIEFSFLGGGLDTSYYEQNNEWYLMRAYVSENVETFKFISDFSSQIMSVHMHFRRHIDVIMSLFLIFAIVLVVMTLTTLWLEPKSTERMILANLNFVCHVFCIQNLSWIVPHNGEKIPKLLLFYHSSLILTCITLIITALLRYLQETSNEAPTWVINKTSYILKSRIGQILSLSILDPKASAGLEADADDNTDLVDPNKKQSVWEYVALIISWMVFFIVFSAYMVILGLYLPTPSSEPPLVLDT